MSLQHALPSVCSVFTILSLVSFDDARLPDAAVAEPPGFSREIARAFDAKEKQQDLLASEYFRLALADLASRADTLTDDEQIARRRCLFELPALLRKLGEHHEALRYSLEYHHELQSLTGTRHRPGRQHNAISISASLVALGDYANAAPMLDNLLAETDEYGPLKPVQRLSCLSLMAIVEERIGASTTAIRHWKNVRAAALDVLRTLQVPESGPSVEMNDSCLLLLITSEDAAPTNSRQSAALLSRVLSQRPVAARREFLLRLTLVALQRQDRDTARRYLTAGLQLSHEARLTDFVSRARMHSLLAVTLTSEQQHDRADNHWQSSAADYESALILARRDSPTSVAPILQQLAGVYTILGQPEVAISSARQQFLERRRTHGVEHLLTIQSQTSLAGTLALTGRSAEADRLFEPVEQFWRKHLPVAAGQLMRVLNNRGAIAKSLGRAGDAQALFDEAIRIHREAYGKHTITPTYVISTANFAGTLAARGRYDEAMELFDQVVKHCDNIGPTADSLRIATLLNMSNVLRTQGQLSLAIGFGKRALTLYEKRYPARSSGAIAIHSALSAAFSQTTQYAHAYRHALRALEISQTRQGQQDRLSTAAAHVTLADVSLQQGAIKSADFHWKIASQIYAEFGRSLHVARIRNRQAVLALAQAQPVRAGELLEEAFQLLQKSGAGPLDLHNVLTNLAEAQRRQGDKSLAANTLASAITLLEQPRIRVSGSEEERARFFARFANAFDIAIEWAISDGQLNRAFALGERRRSRTLLDELTMSGVDLRQAFYAPSGEPLPEYKPLLDREQLLQSKLQALVQASHKQADAEGAAKLQENLNATRSEFRDVWSELRSRSPVYRQLLRDGRVPVTLAAFQTQLRAEQRALVYLVGKSASHVLLVGPSGTETKAYTINLTQRLPSWTGRLDAREGESSMRGAKRLRSLAGESIIDFTDNLGDDLTAERCTRWVNWFRQQLQRRLPLFPEHNRPAVEPDVQNFLTAFGHALLPPELIASLRASAPEHLIVIPDGPLHRIPFEALPLKIREQTQYTLDCMPPMTYASSASALTELASRVDSNNRTEPPQVLIVGAPAYPASSKLLSPLPAAVDECRQLSHLLDAHNTPYDLLLGAAATENNVRQKWNQATILHFAAHGHLDASFGNMFGAIALSPEPASSPSSNQTSDWSLNWNEIAVARLDKCRLAVLSACRTFDGPQRPMEAAVTLSQAFLTAGVDATIASHWNVDDASTADLMVRFYGQLYDTPNGDFSDPTAALARAKTAQRQSSQHSAPFHWSPFVLSGFVESAGLVRRIH